MSGHNLYTFGLAADAGRGRIFFSSRCLSFSTGAGGCKSYRTISDSKWGALAVAWRPWQVWVLFLGVENRKVSAIGQSAHYILRPLPRVRGAHFLHWGYIRFWFHICPRKRNGDAFDDIENTFLLLCSAYVMWRTLGDVWTKCAWCAAVTYSCEDRSSKQGINFPTKTLVQGRTYCSPLRGEELADLTTKGLTRLGTKRDIDITRNNQMYLLDHARLEEMDDWVSK